MFKMMYELFRLARREGLIVLEPHLSTPKESAIFRNTRGFSAITT